MLISVTGLINSGKDTIAGYLIDAHNFKKESFASSLKDAVSSVFGWDRVSIEGATKESREWREQVDQWWANRLGIPHLSPRWVLQNWGTEVLRNHFHDDLWIASLEHKLQNATQHIVLTDTRFPNEVKMVKENFGLMLRVKRGPDPDWFYTAMRANLADAQDARDELKEMGIHASEYSWVGTKFDHTIENDGTLIDLYTKLEKILEEGKWLQE